MSKPIEDYAMLGDCRSAALVCREGSIDWLCLPRFDSEAVFSAILGAPEHGRWLLCPVDKNASSTRAYLGNSLILKTTFSTHQGTVELLDFMDTSNDALEHGALVRIVTCKKGEMPLKTELILRFGYGHLVPDELKLSDGLCATSRPDQIFIRTSQPLKRHDAMITAKFTLREGEFAWFSLSHGLSTLNPPPAINPHEALRNTQVFWDKWSSHLPSGNRWDDQIKRSLVVLKGLSFLPSGAFVAAPTASLPEKLGGERNWDYRFCWLRDSSFMLLSLINSGYKNEARAFLDWVDRTIAGTPEKLQSLYGVSGERQLTEWSADWLPGYENSRPVNFGNAATSQFQLDVYGELISLFEIACLRDVPQQPSDSKQEHALLLELEQRWNEPDEGIWEVRSGRRHFTHSKLMAWLAFKLASQNDKNHFSENDRKRWGALAKQVHAQIVARALHSEGYFVQCYDDDALDASLLLMPTVNFLPGDDPRMVKTVDVILERLTVNGFVERYSTHKSDDGLAAGEGTFLVCSFWMVEALALTGRINKATQLYERLLGLCNDVGLLAEEYDPQHKRMLGNFPQGYSHAALVSAAYCLKNAAQHAQQKQNQK